MDDSEVQNHIEALVAEEHRLYAAAEREGGHTIEERARLEEIRVALDRYWDLLRQRRGEEEFGLDPDQATLRRSARKRSSASSSWRRPRAACCSSRTRSHRPRRHMRTYVRMVGCVLIPRFELVVAAGGLEALAGRAVAIAPEGGPDGPIGEASGPAQAFGVHSGMALAEALARCPTLELLVADPVAVAAAWEPTLRTLEGIGAGVESGAPGWRASRSMGCAGFTAAAMSWSSSRPAGRSIVPPGWRRPPRVSARWRAPLRPVPGAP